MASIQHHPDLYAFGDKKELEAYRKFLIEHKQEISEKICDEGNEIEFEEEGALKNPFKVYLGLVTYKKHIAELLSEDKDSIIPKFPKLVFFGTSEVDARDHGEVRIEWFVAKNGKILGRTAAIEQDLDKFEDEDEDDQYCLILKSLRNDIDISSWMKDEGIVEKLGDIWKDKTFCAGLINIINETTLGCGSYDFDWIHSPEDLCLESVKQGGSLEYVPEELKTAEICLEAVKQNGKALKYVPEKLKTAEICLAAVKKDGSMIEYVPEKLKTAELCLEAVKNPGYGDPLQHVPEKLKTEELCTEAINKAESWGRDSLLEHVPKTLKPKMKKLIKKLEAESEDED